MICRCGLQIEGFDEQEGDQEADQEADQETVEEETLDQAIQAMEESNYLDDNAFQAMAAKGYTNEPSTTNVVRVKYKTPPKTEKPLILSYVTLHPSTLNTERSHLLGDLFASSKRHPEIMRGLDETGRTYDYARAGYSSNAYLDRTRFYQSTELSPDQPRFFYGWRRNVCIKYSLIVYNETTLLKLRKIL